MAGYARKIFVSFDGVHVSITESDDSHLAPHEARIQNLSEKYAFLSKFVFFPLRVFVATIVAAFYLLFAAYLGTKVPFVIDHIVMPVVYFFYDSFVFVTDHIILAFAKLLKLFGLHEWLPDYIKKEI